MLQDVFQLASSLLPVLRDKLDVYTKKLLINEEKELEISQNQLLHQNDNLAREMKKRRRRSIYRSIFPQTTILLGLIAIIIIPIIIELDKDLSIFNSSSPSFYLLAPSFALLVLCLGYITNNKHFSESTQESLAYDKNVKTIVEIKKRLSEIRSLLHKTIEN